MDYAVDGVPDVFGGAVGVGLQWQALVDDPRLIPNAVEETLRTSRRGGGAIPRSARTDLEIDGIGIRAGELVLLDISAGNHDPSVFADPD